MTIHELAPRYIREAQRLLQGLPNDKAEGILKYIVGLLLDEVRKGVAGDLDPSEAPFFAQVDQIYEEALVKGCYFCDRSIDPNAVPFDPKATKICLTCKMKLEKALLALRRPNDTENQP